MKFDEPHHFKDKGNEGRRRFNLKSVTPLKRGKREVIVEEAETHSFGRKVQLWVVIDLRIQAKRSCGSLR